MLDKFLKITITEETVDQFYLKAKDKIEIEKWEGRNKTVKINNFLNAWISEYGWHNLLVENNISHQWAGFFVGKQEDAPLDFIIRIDKKNYTLGIRSRNITDLKKWMEVPYPDDRFRHEQIMIEDFLIISAIIQNQGTREVRYFGAITKKDLLKCLESIKPKYSPRNQELFRPIPIQYFSFPLMDKILEIAEKNDKSIF
jgi:hypothetical protein